MDKFSRRGFATHVLVGICGLVITRLVQPNETKHTLLANETGSIKPHDSYSIHVQNIPVSVELGREDMFEMPNPDCLIHYDIGDYVLADNVEWHAYEIQCPD